MSTSITPEVREYWERASCGTDAANAEKFTPQYFEQIERFRYSVEPFIHEFAQFSRWRNKDVLEVGVGAGTDFIQWVRAGARAVGIDLTDEAIANVQHRVELEQLKPAALLRFDAERLPFDDGSFDLVYSWGVMHHADDPRRVFDEAFRVTRPGGRMKIMLYNRQSLHAWYLAVRYALPRGHIADARVWALRHHQESMGTQAYTEQDIRGWLRSHRYRDLTFRYYDQFLQPAAKLHAVRSVMQRVCPARLRWYMAFELVKER